MALKFSRTYYDIDPLVAKLKLSLVTSCHACAEKKKKTPLGSTPSLNGLLTFFPLGPKRKPAQVGRKPTKLEGEFAQVERDDVPRIQTLDN